MDYSPRDHKRCQTSLSNCWLKNHVHRESEDRSLGDSAADSCLETALRQAGRQPIALRDFSKQGFGEGRIQCNQELLYKGFLLVTLKGLSAF